MEDKVLVLFSSVGELPEYTQSFLCCQWSRTQQDNTHRLTHITDVRSVWVHVAYAHIAVIKYFLPITLKIMLMLLELCRHIVHVPISPPLFS